MPEIQVDQEVKLMQDIPELGLHRGEVAQVCSTWFRGVQACHHLRGRVSRVDIGPHDTRPADAQSDRGRAEEAMMASCKATTIMYFSGKALIG